MRFIDEYIIFLILNKMRDKELYLKTADELRIKIESFSGLKKNWDSYDADEISVKSIMTAHKVLDGILAVIDASIIDVFPMRDGGIQIDVGDFKEIEVLDYGVKEIQFDSNGNIISKYFYTIDYFYV